MSKKGLLAVLAFVLIAAPCFAQGLGRTCDPTGTWIGGGDNPPGPAPTYQLTFVPTGAGRYAVTAQFIPDPGIHSTMFTGELSKVGAQTYKLELIATYDIDGATQELDAVYGDFVMADCDTMKDSITWFGVYLPITSDKVPFVTQPEIEVIRDLVGQPITETYHRVSANYCPVCELGGTWFSTSTPAAVPDALKQKMSRRFNRK